MHEPAAFAGGRTVRGPAEEHEAVQRRRRRGRWPAAVSGGRRMDGVVGIHAMFGELRIRLKKQVRTNPIPFHFALVERNLLMSFISGAIPCVMYHLT